MVVTGTPRSGVAFTMAPMQAASTQTKDSQPKGLDALRAELPQWMDDALARVPVFAVARAGGRDFLTLAGKDGKPEVAFFPDHATAEAWRAARAAMDPQAWAGTRVASYRLSDVAVAHLSRVAPFRSGFQSAPVDLRAADGLPAAVGTPPFACPVFVVRLGDGRYPTLTAKGVDAFVPLYFSNTDAEAMRSRVKAGLESTETVRLEVLDLTQALRIMHAARSGIALRFRLVASEANLRAAAEDARRDQTPNGASPQL